MSVPHLHENENAVSHLLLKSKMYDNQNQNNFENQNKIAGLLLDLHKLLFRFRFYDLEFSRYILIYAH